jgi:hypothetical protein
LDLKLNAPVLFIQEKYNTYENNPLLVIDLGNIKIDSKIVEFNPEKNYKLENNPMLLYDAYNFTLKDFQIMAFD